MLSPVGLELSTQAYVRAVKILLPPSPENLDCWRVWAGLSTELHSVLHHSVLSRLVLGTVKSHAGAGAGAEDRVEAACLCFIMQHQFLCESRTRLSFPKLLSD